MPLSSCFVLVVVDQFNVKRMGTFEPKNNAPVCPHGDGQETLPVAFQRMQAVTREIKLLCSHGVIKNRQNFLNCIHKIWPYPAAVVLLVKPFKAAMLKTPNVADRALADSATYTACPAACSSREISAMIAAASSSSEARID